MLPKNNPKLVTGGPTVRSDTPRRWVRSKASLPRRALSPHRSSARPPTFATEPSHRPRWPDSGLEGIEGVEASLCSPAEPDARKTLRGYSMLQNLVAFIFLA